MSINTETILGSRETLRRYRHSASELTGEFYMDDITTIKSIYSGYFFHNHTGLTKVSLPNCTSIQTSNFFKGCTNLVEVELPILAGNNNNLTNMFADCTSLKNIDLPKLTKMPNSLVSNCPSLERVCMLAVTGYVTQNQPLVGPLPEFQILRVPKYSVQWGVKANDKSWACPKMKLVDCGYTTIITENNSYSILRPAKILIFRRTSVPQLSDSNFKNGAAKKIYVPSSLISQYQEETNWSAAYASGNVEFLPLEGSPYEDPDFDDTEIWNTPREEL